MGDAWASSVVRGRAACASTRRRGGGILHDYSDRWATEAVAMAPTAAATVPTRLEEHGTTAMGPAVGDDETLEPTPQQHGYYWCVLAGAPQCGTWTGHAAAKREHCTAQYTARGTRHTAGPCTVNHPHRGANEGMTHACVPPATARHLTRHVQAHAPRATRRAGRTFANPKRLAQPHAAN